MTIPALYMAFGGAYLFCKLGPFIVPRNILSPFLLMMNHPSLDQA